MRRALAAATLLALAAAPAPAQRFWNTTYAPLAYYSSTDGFWLAGLVRRYSPVGFDDRPEPYLAWVEATAALSTEGSHRVQLGAHAPAWWEGWRVDLGLTARRQNRLGYFGFGNESTFDADSITAAAPYFYRVSRSTVGGRLTVQRRVLGPLRALVGASLTHTDLRDLPGASVFRRDVASGVVDAGDIPFDDVALRFGLVVDTRDAERDPHRGMLVEALYATSRRYARATASVRGWIEPWPRVGLSARVAAEQMGGDPPLAPQLEMESSEAPVAAVGGLRSLRGYPDARFLGAKKLIGGIEARYALVWKPTLFELKIGAFFDVGRVFGAEPFRLTTDGLHHGGGVQVGGRFLRNTVVLLGIAFGTEGTVPFFAGEWAF